MKYVTGGVEDASNVTAFAPGFFQRFRPNTAMDMINRLPGFSFDGGSAARGFSGTGGNVLIDGERPPSRGDSLSAVISRIPAGGVERIEIIRGGAEGIDMQGRPIIANIVRRAEAGVSGSARAWTDIGEAGNVSAGGVVQMRRQANGQLVEGEMEVRSSRGFNAERRWRVTPDDVVFLIGHKDMLSENQLVELTGAWDGEALGGRLRVNGLAALEAWQYDRVEERLVPGGFEVSAGEDDEAAGEIGLRYTRTLSGGEAVEVIAFQSLNASEGMGVYNTPLFTSGDSGENTSGESIVRASVGLPSSGAWTFDGGAEGVFNFRDVTGERIYNGAPYSLDGDQYRVEEMRAEAFGTATWAVRDNLSLESALRYEWSRIDAMVGDRLSEKELSYLKPRVNLSWAPESGHQIGLQVERTVGQLDFGAFASSASFEDAVFGEGNPEIEPEKHWVFDARYERQFGGQTSLVVSYEQRRTEDVLGRVVTFVPPVDPGDDPSWVESTRNLDEAFRETLAVDATFELDAMGMSGGILGLGVDLADSKVNDPVTGESRLLSGHDDWAWNFSLQQTLAGGDFRWSVSAYDNADSLTYSPRSISDGRGGPTINASVTWKPSPGWTLGASANDLVAEPATFEKVFYDAPRNVGAPEYTEFRTAEHYRTLHLSVRRDF
jgi:hypothetical protein